MKRTPRTLTALGAFAVLGAAALVRMDTPANAYPFPCNANTTMAVYVPSSSAHGTLMLEDQWPGYGDLDFNDAVVSYQYSLAYNSSGNLVQLVGTYNVLAAGSGHANGFALHLPIPKANVSSVTLQLGNGAPAALAPRAAESELVVDVLPNLKAAFNAANDGHQINTDPAAAVLPGATYRLVVTLSTPTALSAAGAPFDAFFYWSQAPSHEIHRPGFAGTSAMDGSLFGTLQDGSTGARHFVDNRGIPYVLDVPQGIKWSKESVDISGGYSQLAAFGQSGGTSNQSWYQSPTNASLFTSGQGGAQPPSASFIGGDGAYSVDGTCNLCIANNVTCPAAPDQCHTQGTCAPMTGVCSAAPAKADGTACDDGNSSTNNDVCTGGVCAGTMACTGQVYATLDPAQAGGHIGLSNGNLTATAISLFTWGEITANIGKTHGKWYWEFTQNSVESPNGDGAYNGITNAFVGGNVQPGLTTNGWTYTNQGNKAHNNAQSAYGAPYGSADVIGVAVDIDAGTVTFYKNNVSQGTAFMDVTSPVFPVFALPSHGQVTANFGASGLAYAPPAGYSAGLYSCSGDGQSSATAATSCAALHQSFPGLGSGVYWLNPGGGAFQGYCDMTTDGGGWTLVMRGYGGFNNNAGIWPTTGAVNAAALAAAPGATTAKYSDATINALRTATGKYRLVSDGNFSATRFVGAGCVYAHTTAPAANSPCSTTYGDVALTQGAKVATSVCSWHRGIVDTPCMQSTGFFITDHTVSGIPWVVSDGTGDHGASSLGQNAGANYTMWVRADVTVNDGSSAANAGTSCGSIHQTYPALGNGTYWLDFDGAGPTVPAQYYCDMTSGGFTYNTADAAAINQGYYEIAYNDQGSCIPSCPNNVVKVYPVGAGQAMNCNPYVWTAADLSCMVDRYSTSASSPATISIGTGGDGVCVNKGDLCPLVLKSHYFRYRCY